MIFVFLVKISRLYIFIYNIYFLIDMSTYAVPLNKNKNSRVTAIIQFRKNLL